MFPAAYAACGESDVTSTNECVAKVDQAGLTSTDKDVFCKYMVEMNACYPSCYCDDATYKETIDASMTTMEAQGCGEVKCGAAGTLQASLLFGLVAVAAAFKNSF